MFTPICQCILLQIYNTSVLYKCILLHVLLQRTFSSYLISLHLMWSYRISVGKLSLCLKMTLGSAPACRCELVAVSKQWAYWNIFMITPVSLHQARSVCTLHVTAFFVSLPAFYVIINACLVADSLRRRFLCFLNSSFFDFCICHRFNSHVSWTETGRVVCGRVLFVKWEAFCYSVNSVMQK